MKYDGLKVVIVGKLLWCERNTSLQGMLLKENDQLFCSICNIASAHHLVSDYFPITAQHAAFYS